MPGLLMLFGPLIDKTAPPQLCPQDLLCRQVCLRHAPCRSHSLCRAGCHRLPALRPTVPYAYGYGLISAPKLNETQIAENMIDDNFSTKNLMALVVSPRATMTRSAPFSTSLSSYDEVDSTLGLSNVEAMGGYMLTDRLTPRQFSELTDLDYEVAELLYAAYAADQRQLRQDRRRTSHLLCAAHRYVPLSLRRDAARAMSRWTTSMTEHAGRRLHADDERRKLQLQSDALQPYARLSARCPSAATRPTPSPTPSPRSRRSIIPDEQGLSWRATPPTSTTLKSPSPWTIRS